MTAQSDDLHEFAVRIEWHTRHSQTYPVIARSADDAKQIAAIMFRATQAHVIDTMEIEDGYFPTYYTNA